MNGAELMFDEAEAAGIEMCFANPGTTEMPMVLALDQATGIRAVLALHENVCSGAADGYARIAGKPASTLLHLGPGFANSLANLHNARRAFSPVVNFVGEHASWHISADAPLNSDIEGLARPVSDWVRRVMNASETARDVREAVNAATSLRGSVSTLIVPHDHQMAPVQRKPFRAKPRQVSGSVDKDMVVAAAELLSKARSPLFLLGGNAIFGEGLAAGQRALPDTHLIQEATEMVAATKARRSKNQDRSGQPRNQLFVGSSERLTSLPSRYMSPSIWTAPAGSIVYVRVAP